MTPVDDAQTRSTVHSSEVIFEGRQFSFVKDRVTLPHQVDAEMAFVRHPGSAVILPVFADQTIGLIKQYRYVVDSTLYEVPAGTMDPHELPEQCAARELEEETGYVAKELIPMGKVLLLPAYSDETSHMYLAKNLTPTAQKLDADEIITVERFEPGAVAAMIDSGDMVDALSILAVYRGLRYLQHRVG